MEDTKWRNLQALKQLHNEGFITMTEYRARLKQLIDELTGTTISTPSRTRYSEAHRESIDAAIVARPPPDFRTVEEESAIKWSYNFKKEKWSSERIRVKLDATPFARGSLRVAYHMQIFPSKDPDTSGKVLPCPASPRPRQAKRSFSETIVAGERVGGRSVATIDDVNMDVPQVAGEEKENKNKSYVAKVSLRPQDNTNREGYFRDVEMQCLASYIADRFNLCNPPKLVRFLKAFVVELEDRVGRPICGVEQYIGGPYRKHNSNFGYVSEDERNTPQAFSHFSWHISSGEVMVCDLQGVSDVYTDPQVSSFTILISSIKFHASFTGALSLGERLWQRQFRHEGSTSPEKGEASIRFITTTV
ncbi:hypothetical protein AAMO2058_000336800 [Amorphochlora amoebiformis]